MAEILELPLGLHLATLKFWLSAHPTSRELFVDFVETYWLNRPLLSMDDRDCWNANYVDIDQPWLNCYAANNLAGEFAIFRLLSWSNSM